MKNLSLIVVSHGQSGLVKALLESFQAHLPGFPVEIVMIENLKSEILDNVHDFSIPIHQIINPTPYGLAKNINSAVQHTQGEYLCIVNPDVVFVEDCISKLIACMEDNKIDIIAPLVVSSSGEIQDSFRSIPTVWELIGRYLGTRSRITISDTNKFVYPEWIATMFLVMRSEIFKSLNGFDERYRLYFEDVDFCLRATQAGYMIAVDTQAKIIHDAQRMSRKHPRYLYWHLCSAMKFYFSPAYKKHLKQIN